MDYSHEYINQTFIHPLAAAILILLIAVMLVIPRRFAAFPILAIGSFVSCAQRISVAGFDLDIIRLIVLAGWIRILARGEHKHLVFNLLDKTLILWAASSTICFTLLHQSASVLVNRLGMSFDCVTLYFFFRCTVRTWDDVRSFARVLAIISIPVAFAFFVELSTRYNAFAVFGRVPAITSERQGRLRCQGAFVHPIIAGCFWASAIPAIGMLWWSDRRSRILSVVGVLACLVIILACSSSTPVTAIAFAFVGAVLYNARRHLKAIRWGLLLTILALHFIMNGPVWSLAAKIDIAGGSTGYHRFHLIDQAIRRFREWWLLGTKSTAHWGYGLHDVTNQFVLEGVRGGILTLGLFLAVLVVAYKMTGAAVRNSIHTADRVCAWGLGVMLLVHTINFLGISYFGQISIMWYATIGLIGSSRDYHKTGATAGASPGSVTPVGIKKRPSSALVTSNQTVPIIINRMGYSHYHL